MSSVAPPAELIDSRRAFWRGVMIAFGFWTLLALTSSVAMQLAAMGEGEARSWQRTLAWNFPDFWSWMLLTPWIAWLGKAASRHGWARFFTIHIPLGLATAALHTLVLLLLYWEMHGTDKSAISSLSKLFRVEFVYQFHLDLITYWVVLAVLRGSDFQRRLKSERLRSAQLEGQLAQAQLHALRMQLQPHFLFNTLNAISALALSDPATARTMIARLSDFLRLTLEADQRQSVPLARELQSLESYLAIQRMRFHNRLETQWQVADDALDAAVPHLILQPLVENALQHGLLPLSGGGSLWIEARREGGELCMTVEDNGRGLPDRDMREGIGLGNTRARLDALAGRLSLLARPGGGTRVEVRIPYEASVA
jgi:two-component system LytT family sensor kinase